MERPGASAQAPSHGFRQRPRPWGSRRSREDPSCTTPAWGGVTYTLRPHGRTRSPPRPKNPHEATLSLRGPARSGGTHVYPPLCGGGTSPCAPKTPTGRPYPSAAQAGPEGLGCNRHCVGGGGDFSVCPQTPTGRPYPSAALAGPEGLGCNRRCVGENLSVCPQTPTGRPYPSAAQAGPEGLGCNRHCVGEGPLRAPPKPPRGVPIPPRPRQDRRDSGVTTAVWGRDLSVCPRTPTGRPYPSPAQIEPEGLGCNRHCVGEGPLRAPPKPPRGVPIPPRPRHDRRDLGVTAAVWGKTSPCVPEPPRGVPIPPRPR